MVEIPNWSPGAASQLTFWMLAVEPRIFQNHMLTAGLKTPYERPQNTTFLVNDPKTVSLRLYTHVSKRLPPWLKALKATHFFQCDGEDHNERTKQTAEP